MNFIIEIKCCNFPAMLWQQKPTQSVGAASQALKQHREDEVIMQGMPFDQIEAEFRVRVGYPIISEFFQQSNTGGAIKCFIKENRLLYK